MKITSILFAGAFSAIAALAIPACDDKKEEPKKDDKAAAKTEDKKTEVKVEEKKAEPPAAAPAGAAPEGGGGADKIGVPECDEYVEKYMTCIDQKFDATAQEDARKAVQESMKQWQEAAQGPEKDKLAEQCKTQLETAKTALADKNCQW